MCSRELQVSLATRCNDNALIRSARHRFRALLGKDDKVAGYMRHLGCFVLLSFLCGCTAMRPPSGDDRDYPKDWPPQARLGDECKKLSGDYENDGVYTDARGLSRAVKMTDLFLGQEVREARRVSLLVSTTKRDKHNDTFAALKIVVPLPSRDLERQLESYCVREQLYFLASTGGSGLPYVYFEGHQVNAWLIADADGDLIVRIGKYGGGLALVVPFGWETIAWARFKSLTQ